MGVLLMNQIILICIEDKFKSLLLFRLSYTYPIDGYFIGVNFLFIKNFLSEWIFSVFFSFFKVIFIKFPNGLTLLSMSWKFQITKSQCYLF